MRTVTASIVALPAASNAARIVATSYCQSQAFGQAKSFRRVDRDEITGAVPAGGRNACAGGNCDRSCHHLLAVSARSHFSTQSAHFGTSVVPHGMIGTVEVEFFGEPSMMRSE